MQEQKLNFFSIYKSRPRYIALSGRAVVGHVKFADRPRKAKRRSVLLLAFGHPSQQGCKNWRTTEVAGHLISRQIPAADSQRHNGTVLSRFFMHQTTDWSSELGTSCTSVQQNSAYRPELAVTEKFRTFWACYDDATVARSRFLTQEWPQKKARHGLYFLPKRCASDSLFKLKSTKNISRRRMRVVFFCLLKNQNQSHFFASMRYYAPWGVEGRFSFSATSSSIVVSFVANSGTKCETFLRHNYTLASSVCG